MCSIIPPGKDWIDLLGAFIMPVTFGAFGIYIAYQQRQVDRNRLKFQLFDIRYKVYEKIGSFISDILINGEVRKNAETEFLRDTKSVYILFDEDIKQFASEIYNKAVELHALNARLESLREEEKRSLNIETQTNIKQWYQDQLKDMEDKFAKYLRLKH